MAARKEAWPFPKVAEANSSAMANALCAGAPADDFVRTLFAINHYYAQEPFLKRLESGDAAAREACVAQTGAAPENYVKFIRAQTAMGFDVLAKSLWNLRDIHTEMNEDKAGFKGNRMPQPATIIKIAEVEVVGVVPGLLAMVQQLPRPGFAATARGEQMASTAG